MSGSSHADKEKAYEMWLSDDKSWRGMNVEKEKIGRAF